MADDKMTYNEACKLAKQLLEEYGKAQTKKEVEDLFLAYSFVGRGSRGFGYRALCRLLFMKMSIERAMQGYKEKEQD
jgi:hypothetical protein